jgi:hypothetical protein
MADSNTGKTVQVDGDVVGELFAVFADGDDPVEQIRKRMAYIGASFGVVDELSGLGEGSTTKYLSSALTLHSTLRITQALGLKAMLVVDPKLTAEMSPSWGSRDASKVNARRPVQLGPTTLKRVRGAVLSELGREGCGGEEREADASGAAAAGHTGGTGEVAEQAIAAGPFGACGGLGESIRQSVLCPGQLPHRLCTPGPTLIAPPMLRFMEAQTSVFLAAAPTTAQVQPSPSSPVPSSSQQSRPLQGPNYTGTQTRPQQPASSQSRPYQNPTERR